MFRITTLGWILAGAVVVAAAVLLGRDPRRVATSGPAWRRRLMGAGLATLAALGLLPAAEASPRSAGERLRVLCAGDEDLAQTEEWKAIEATWAEAEEVASGKRGDYPFDEAGRKKLLADLDQMTERIGALVKKGLLSAPEADLILQDRAELVSGVQGKRPTEMKEATCYKPMMLPMPAQKSASDLAARLPILEGLAQEGKLPPDAVRKILVSIEADLAVLASEKEMAEVPAEERAASEKTRDAVKADVEAIRKALDGSK